MSGWNCSFWIVKQVKRILQVNEANADVFNFFRLLIKLIHSCSMSRNSLENIFIDLYESKFSAAFMQQKLQCGSYALKHNTGNNF